MSTAPRAPWLEPLTLVPGEVGTLRIGTSALLVTRRAREWRVQTATTSDLGALDVELRWPDPAPGPLPFSGDARLMRFATDGRADALRLRPRLADRPVVVRPADKLYLLAGAEVDVFVSTILWIGLELADSGTPLVDLPALRPSDTWFGPSTREGELAYASRTSARLDLADLPARPHRATTCIHLVNAGRTPQSLARVMLPAPSLELWRMPSGLLWTQTVDLTLGDGEESPLRFRPGPPRDSGGAAELVAGPRRPTAQKNILLRAMSAIF
ncbi:MAG: hypothetical protein IT385_17520 [Deltaproteobacteria bacterium]|nr:hypothetical protein [Deltaproteobacteria bacterium]